MNITRVDTPRTGERDLSWDHADGCGEVPAGYQEGQLFKSGRVCAGTGSEPSCQLCPHSPTNHRLDRPAAYVPPAATALTAPPPMPSLNGLLDWSKDAGEARGTEHFDGYTTKHEVVMRMKPCRYCGQDTPLRNGRGQAAHKVCAEENGETNADLPGTFYGRKRQTGA